MKIKPILFSTPMVQSILEGRKTQTRRVVKSNHESGLFVIWRRKLDGEIVEITSLDYEECSVDPSNDIQPKYKIGDIIYVREAFYAFGKWVKEGTTKTGKQKYRFVDLTEKDFGHYNYVADGIPENIIIATVKDGKEHYYKRNSLFMPREAARIFLKVTNVRAERLQDISEEDAIAEGIIKHTPVPGDGPIVYKNYCGSSDRLPYWIKPVLSFKSLWQSINGDESWNENPFVLVYDFERVEKPKNFLV